MSGESWFVAGETKRLDLSGGQWLVVKTHLNTGEEREMLRRASQVGTDGVRRLDALLNAQATIVAYVVDWSLTGIDGKPVVIRGKDAATVIAILDALDPDRFREIKEAVEAHEQAMADARAEEKKLRTGVSGSSPTSPSPDAVAGAMSGSAILT